jgi:hypothetical protein
MSQQELQDQAHMMMKQKSMESMDMMMNNRDHSSMLHSLQAKQMLSKEDQDMKDFYDKNISFFDRISCESNEKSNMLSQKPKNWKEERKINTETFGVMPKVNNSYHRSYNNYHNRNNNYNNNPRTNYRSSQNQNYNQNNLNSSRGNNNNDRRDSQQHMQQNSRPSQVNNYNQRPQNNMRSNMNNNNNNNGYRRQEMEVNGNSQRRFGSR